MERREMERKIGKRQKGARRERGEGGLGEREEKG